MPQIYLDRYARIVAGENEGYFLQVHHDEQGTHGYYIFLVDRIDNPSDGGDLWAKDMAGVENLFRVSEWEVEWL
jgi:hypothetical protein